MPNDSDCRIYIGNLPPDIRTKDVEDLFYKFGDISFVDLKTRRGPPFAFVEFKDPRDAKAAVNSRDGYDYDGYKLRVEFPKGRERGPGGIFKGHREREGYSSSRKNGGPPTRRSNYRVKITGLPPTGSWQDLKDHMREAGEVCYADVFKDGSGVVEFLRRDDMRYAIKKLDDSRFRSHEGEVSYVRVAEDTGHGSLTSRSRSRSRSTKRSRASPTYSPAHDSRSPSRSRSRSRSSRDDSEDRVSRHSRSISRSRSPSPTRRHHHHHNNNQRRRNSRDTRSPSNSRSRSRSLSNDDNNGSNGSRSHSRSRSPSR